MRSICILDIQLAPWIMQHLGYCGMALGHGLMTWEEVFGMNNKVFRMNYKIFGMTLGFNKAVELGWPWVNNKAL